MLLEMLLITSSKKLKNMLIRTTHLLMPAKQICASIFVDTILFYDIYYMPLAVQKIHFLLATRFGKQNLIF